MIDQLLQQYISEIERVAAMVHNNGEFDGEETTNFEIGMAGEGINWLTWLSGGIKIEVI